MKKWALSAIVYLLIVMGGYTTYDKFLANEEVNNEEHSENRIEVDHGNMDHSEMNYSNLDEVDSGNEHSGH